MSTFSLFTEKEEYCTVHYIFILLQLENTWSRSMMKRFFKASKLFWMFLSDETMM